MNQTLNKKLRIYLGLSVTVFLLIILLNLGLITLSAQVTITEKQNANDAISQAEITEVSQLVNQAKENYQSGNFSEAIKIWQEALDILSSQSDRLNQGMVLSNLALAHQKLGQWEQAKGYIVESLSLLKNQPTPLNQDYEKVLAQVLNTQGGLQLAQGQAKQALSTWEAANQHNYSQRSLRHKQQVPKPYLHLIPTI